MIDERLSESDSDFDAAAYDEMLRLAGMPSGPPAGVKDDLASTIQLLNAAFSQHEPRESETIPEWIGRFEIKRLLGRGGFGSVFLAHDPVLGRDVAIKVARATNESKRRLLLERKVAAAMHHPNILQVFESGESGDGIYIVSEFCRGPTLAQEIRRRSQKDICPEPPTDLLDSSATCDDVIKATRDAYLRTNLAQQLAGNVTAPYPADDCARMIRSLADAVEHAHQRGVIHRDIKPGNILLEPSESKHKGPGFVPRLTDFGLATDMNLELAREDFGRFLGTLPYVSPEQAQGNSDDLTVASDVYSLGVVLYELLTGRVPFADESRSQTLRMICEQAPPAPKSLNSSIARDLQAICLKCLHKRPADRYGSAADLRDDLDRYLRGEVTNARVVGLPERLLRWTRRHPREAAFAGVSLMSLLILLGGLTLHLHKTKRHSEVLSAALVATRAEQRRTAQAQVEAALAGKRADEQREIARVTSYRSDMRLAYDLWSRGFIHSVREILANQAGPAEHDLRGPEWHLLLAETDAKYHQLGKSGDAATECVVTQDGQTAYSAATDGVVRVWDLASGCQRLEFKPGAGPIHGLALSPDESVIAIGGATDETDRAVVHLLNAETGQLIDSHQTHETTIESISFSPDGRWLAAGSRYQPVQLTRLDDRKTFRLPASRRNRTVAFSEDSRFLSVAESYDHYSIWRLDDDEPEVHSRIQPQGRFEPYISQFVPDSSLLATGYTASHAVEFYNVRGRRRFRAEAGRFENPSQALSCLSLAAAGEGLAAGDETGRVLMWRYPPESLKPNQPVSNAAAQASLCPHEARVTSVNLLADGRLISTGEDGRVSLTDPNASGGRHVCCQGIRCLTSVLDHHRLLVGCDDWTVRDLALDDERFRRRNEDHGRVSLKRSEWPEPLIRAESVVRALALSPDRQHIVVGTDSGAVRCYDRDSGGLLREFAPPQEDDNSNSISSIVFSPDGGLIAFADSEGHLEVCEFPGGNSIHSETFENVNNSLAFSDDGRLLAVGGRSANVRIFQVESFDLQATLAGPGSAIQSLDFNSTGNCVAMAHQAGLRLVDLDNREVPVRIFGHPGHCSSVTFSASDRTIISVDDRGCLRFADGLTGTVFGQVTLPAVRRTQHERVHCNQDTLLVCRAGDDGETHLHLWSLK